MSNIRGAFAGRAATAKEISPRFNHAVPADMAFADRSRHRDAAIAARIAGTLEAASSLLRVTYRFPYHACAAVRDRIATGWSSMPIQNFSHRGLDELFHGATTRRIQRSQQRKLILLMDLIAGAGSLEDFAGVSHFHALRGNRRGVIGAG